MREKLGVRIKALSVIGATALICFGCSDSKFQFTGVSGVEVESSAFENPEVEKAKALATVKPEHSNELSAPIALKSEGKRIDIGKLSRIGHAGPTVADVDHDGDQDLLVGDFPGYFWFFENTKNDKEPRYVSQGKLQAGGEDAKTPVY